MIGSDPLGPDGLDELQRENLRTRQESARRFRNPFSKNYDPETLNEAHWWVQPTWVKVVTFVIGIPCFLYLKYGADQIDPFKTTLGQISLGGFIFVALLQMIFVFRGYWRMDI